MGFAVFHGGIGPLDTKGRARMVERDVQVECGGVAIEPGDIVFGDIDGVVVVPRAHENAVIDKAIAKVLGENNTRDALRKGEPLAQVFRRFGIPGRPNAAEHHGEEPSALGTPCGAR